jgi:Regulator of chromosome condensation (RCC1) repeat
MFEGQRPRRGRSSYALRRPRRPFRLCALAVLSAGLLLAPGAAQATTTPTVVVWGCGGYAENFGQCSVPSGLSDVTAISARLYHNLALKGDGSVVAWGCEGAPDFGQCSVPSDLSGVTAISAGYRHNLALKADGTVVAWGCGGGLDFGQCSVPGDLSGVTAISAGVIHSLALKGDGTVVAWGFCDAYGGQCSVPSDLSGVTAIAAGLYHSLALKGDGTVVAWCPIFNFGQCNVPSNLSGVTAIAAGAFQSLALKGDGTVVAWGCGGGGQDFGQCSVPGDLSGVTAISAGDFHNLALKGDGTVVAWGCGGGLDFGQCSVPSNLSGVTAISAGYYHSLALGVSNSPPDCSAVAATPSVLRQMRDQMALITLAGATDADGDALHYHIDGVTQDEYLTGIGDDTFPDAALTDAGANSNKVFVRSEANSHFNGRVYRIAYTVADGNGGTCSGTAGTDGTTTAKVGVERTRGTPAIDDGNAMSWDSFTGASVP